MNSNIKVAFDCIGCLVDYQGNPNDEIISAFHLFKNLGCDVIVWNTEGCADNFLKKLCLTARVIKKGSEAVDIAFDDMPNWLKLIDAKVKFLVGDGKKPDDTWKIINRLTELGYLDGGSDL